MMEASVPIIGYTKAAFDRNLKLIPYRTGNLRYKATKLKNIPGGCMVFIDLNTAPYGEYINRPGYRTHGYWERFVDSFISDLIKECRNEGSVEVNGGIL